MGMGVTSWPRESALPSPPRGACPGRLAQRSTGRRPGSPCRPAVRGRSRRLGPSQGAIGFLYVRQRAGEIVRFLTQARSDAAGEPAGAHAEGPARPAHAPRPRGAGLAGARRPGPRRG